MDSSLDNTLKKFNVYAKNLTLESDSDIDYEVAFYFDYRVDLYEANSNQLNYENIFAKPKAVRVIPKKKKFKMCSIKE